MYTPEEVAPRAGARLLAEGASRDCSNLTVQCWPLSGDQAAYRESGVPAGVSTLQGPPVICPSLILDFNTYGPELQVSGLFSSNSRNLSPGSVASQRTLSIFSCRCQPSTTSCSHLFGEDPLVLFCSPFPYFAGNAFEKELLAMSFVLSQREQILSWAACPPEGPGELQLEERWPGVGEGEERLTVGVASS